MAIFVHIADERNAAQIKRAGLKLPRLKPERSAERPWGVFALPVTPNFVLSHQWVRELKKRGFRVAVGVYFDVPDTDKVWVGRYNGEKALVTAAEAGARLLREGELGLEVILPRSVPAKDVRAIRALPQALGWRHFPEAHEKGIFCACKFCQRGEMKSQRLRKRHGENAL